MNVTLTPEDLIAFEEEIAQAFLAKKIRAPIHLAGGNEVQLLDVFRNYVDPDDWCLCSWRSHYHCLLKGVPRDKLKNAIIAGRSIDLSFPEQRILSSAIVGGTLPIAVGIAMGIKRRGGTNKCVAFIGDMTSECGIVHECLKYASRMDLPLIAVVEDNGKSVATPTAEAWGKAKQVRYEYVNTRPHVGTGTWVTF